MIALLALCVTTVVTQESPVAVVVNAASIPGIKGASWPQEWESRSGEFRKLEIVTSKDEQFAFDRSLFGLSDIEGFSKILRESMSDPKGVVSMTGLTADARQHLVSYLTSASSTFPGPFTSGGSQFKNLAVAAQPCLSLTFSDGKQDFEVVVPAALLTPQLAQEIAFEFSDEEMKNAAGLAPKTPERSDPAIIFENQVDQVTRAKVSSIAINHLRDLVISATTDRDRVVSEWLAKFSDEVLKTFPALGTDVLGVGIGRLPASVQRLLQSGMAPGTPASFRGNAQAWSQVKLKNAKVSVGLTIVGKNKETGAVQAQFLRGN